MESYMNSWLCDKEGRLDTPATILRGVWANTQGSDLLKSGFLYTQGWANTQGWAVILLRGGCMLIVGLGLFSRVGFNFLQGWAYTQEYKPTSRCERTAGVGLYSRV